MTPIKTDCFDFSAFVTSQCKINCLNDVKLSGTKNLSVSTTSRKVKRIRKVGVLYILMIFLSYFLSFTILFCYFWFWFDLICFVYCSLSLTHSLSVCLSVSLSLYYIHIPQKYSYILSPLLILSLLPPSSLYLWERYTSITSTQVHTHSHTDTFFGSFVLYLHLIYWLLYLYACVKKYLPKILEHLILFCVYFHYIFGLTLSYLFVPFLHWILSPGYL